MFNLSLKDLLISILLILAYIFLALVIIIMILGVPKSDLHTFLSFAAFYILEIIFILFIIALVFNFKYIKNICKEIGKKYILLLLLISIMGILATSFIAPRIHRIYYDEDIYNNIAQCIAENKQAVMCNEGYYENDELAIIRSEYYKQPAGFPYLASVVFRIFGTNELFAFLLNNIIFGLTIIVIFFITYLLFKDAFAGLLASLSFLIIPINLHWFNTCAVEPSTAFFLCVPVLALLLYLKNKKPINLFFLVCSLAFSFYFRMESLLIFTVILLLLLLKNIRIFTKLKIYIFGVILLLLSAGIIIHIFAVWGQSWGAAESKFSFDHFFPILGTNSIFYVKNIAFPLLLTLFGITGLIFYKNKSFYKEKLALFIWFLLFWGIFLFFYAGSYEYGQDVRFAILSFAPLSIFAGLGISFLCNLLKDKIKHVRLVVVLLLIFNFTWFLPFIRAELEEAWAARNDHNYAAEFAELMPDNSIIYTHNPNIFLLRKKSAVQSSIGMHYPDVIDQHLSRFKGGVYVHYNYWSNVEDPQQRQYTEFLLNSFNYQIIKEYFYRNFKYGLYKILSRKEGEL